MDLNEFKLLLPTAQKDYYEHLVQKKEDHLDLMLYRCKNDVILTGNVLIALLEEAEIEI